MTTAALTASSHVPPLHYVFHKLDMPEIHERRGNHTTAPCKVPTHPYAFLSDTGRSENRIFHLDSSLHSRLITKYAHLVEMPLMHLETTSSSSVIDCTLQVSMIQIIDQGTFH